MRWLSIIRLARFVRTSSGRSDRGAISMIVAVLLGGVVVLGAASLSIDVGNIMWERRQLQNGADASALSLAQTCARTPAQCTNAAALTSLAPLNNANASDNLNGFDGVCGRPASLGSPCPSDVQKPPVPLLTDCPVLPSWLLNSTIPYVEAHTRTQTPSGSILRPFVAQSFGYPGETVKACARAAWGPPGNGTAIVPVTFSLCNWYLSTANGTSYPAVETALPFNGANDAACATWAGHNFPGGFGWLFHDATCSVKTDQNGWVDALTGLGAGNDCGSVIQSMVGKTVYLPIFDCMDPSKNFCPGVTSTGTHSWYHIKGYAAFHLTAVDVTGPVKANEPGYPTLAAKALCAAKGGKCMYGWFLGNMVTSLGAIDPTAPNLGLTVIQPVG